MAGWPWINPTTFANRRLALAAMLAPLAVVGVAIAIGTGLLLIDLDLPAEVEEPGLAMMLGLAFAMAYPIGLLGVLLICLPAFFLLRYYGKQVGLVYVVLGFVGGAILNPQVLVAAGYLVSDHPWSPDLMDEALATVPLYGPLGALVGAAFFWLLIRMDRVA